MTVKHNFIYNVVASVLILVTTFFFIYVNSTLELLTYLSLIYNYVNLMNMILTIAVAIGIITLLFKSNNEKIKQKQIAEENLKLEQVNRAEINKQFELLNVQFIETKENIHSLQKNFEANLEQVHRKLDNKIQLYVINQNTLKNKLLYLLNNIPYSNELELDAQFKGSMKKIISAVVNIYTEFRKLDKHTIDYRDIQNIVKELTDILLSDNINSVSVESIGKLAAQILEHYNFAKLERDAKSSTIILNKFEIFVEEAYKIFSCAKDKIVIPNIKEISNNLHDLYFVLQELNKIADIIPKQQQKRFILIQAAINDILNEAMVLTEEQKTIKENKIRFEILKFLEQNT